MADFIPGPDAAFDAFFNNIVRYVTGKCAAKTWTHIPAEALTNLTNAYAAWHAAYEATLKPCTPPETAEKNRVRDVSGKILRDFINVYLRFHPAVTEEDKRNMGLRIPDSRGIIDPPGAGPVFSIIQIGPRLLGVIFRKGEEGRKGSRPPGVKGARIHYGVFDKPPANQKELPFSVWATRCPHKIEFPEADRGKRAYFALKWEIEREDGESPWSDMISEIIP
jgi:hypothetical protein